MDWVLDLRGLTSHFPDKKRGRLPRATEATIKGDTGFTYRVFRNTWGLGCSKQGTYEALHFRSLRFRGSGSL